MSTRWVYIGEKERDGIRTFGVELLKWEDLKGERITFEDLEGEGDLMWWIHGVRLAHRIPLIVYQLFLGQNDRIKNQNG